MRSLPLLLAAALALLAGCAHYRLGTAAEPPFRTLHVAPLLNDTQLPQAVAPLTTALRDTLLRDGRLTLAPSPDHADATLRVTLVRFTRELLTSRPDDTGLARKFDLVLAAACTLTDNRTGAKLFENRTIEVRQQIFATAAPGRGDTQQLQAEHQAVPLLARALADKVAHTVTDVW